MADFDISKVKQRDDVERQKLDAEAAERVRRRKGRARKVKPVLRHQQKGPITKGPRAYLHCSTCSEIFSTPEKTVHVGVPKQHAREHLKAHQEGTIKRPVEAAS